MKIKIIKVKKVTEVKEKQFIFSKDEAKLILDILGGMSEDTCKLIYKGSKNRSKLPIDEFMKASSSLYYEMSNIKDLNN